MEAPAHHRPGAAPRELTAEAVLLRQFMLWLFAATVAVWLLVLGLWLLYHAATAQVMLAAVTFVLFPAFFYAYRLTGQNRADGALLLISSVI